MEVILAVTKTCHHCPLLEQEFKKLGVHYCVQYYDDHPEMVQKYNIKQSPVVIVDDKVVFHGMPSISELEKFFSKKTG